MPKVGMQPIRRQQLIEATLTAIDQVGMGDASIALIARLAGVSNGIISHYFQDKNGLIAATMRSRPRLWIARCRSADGPPVDNPHQRRRSSSPAIRVSQAAVASCKGNIPLPCPPSSASSSPPPRT